MKPLRPLRWTWRKPAVVVLPAISAPSPHAAIPSYLPCTQCALSRHEARVALLERFALGELVCLHALLHRPQICKPARLPSVPGNEAFSAHSQWLSVPSAITDHYLSEHRVRGGTARTHHTRYSRFISLPPRDSGLHYQLDLARLDQLPWPTYPDLLRERLAPR